MYIWPHIHNLRDVYTIVGSLVVGWFANNLWDWFKHAFWLGFKTALAEQIRLGRQLTPEENAALTAKIKAKLDSEWRQKVRKFADVASDEEPLPPSI